MLHQRIRGLSPLVGLLLAALAAVVISGCGSSAGGSAQTLLKQTFSGSHKVNSGNLQFSIAVDPIGSRTLTAPITLAFGGPFQSLGTGKLPQSDFTVSVGIQGHTGALSIVSTGTKGFVTLSGVSYQLPAASFEKLESSFSSIATSGSGGSSSSAAKPGVLGRLGIDPLHWLADPTVVGSESIGGTATTHIRAKVDVPEFLAGLDTFLAKASSLGVTGASKLPHGLPAATQSRIASEIRNPTFDLWTGNSDKTLRKLTVGLTLPVTGEVATLLGGISSAAITLTLQYTDLNASQTIAAPTDIEPYSVFSGKLAGLVQEVESEVASGALGGSGTGATGAAGSTGGASSGQATGTGTTTAPSTAAGATGAYGQCITAAGSDIAKMQRCASLLNNAG